MSTRMVTPFPALYVCSKNGGRWTLDRPLNQAIDLARHHTLDLVLGSTHERDLDLARHRTLDVTHDLRIDHALHRTLQQSAERAPILRSAGHVPSSTFRHSVPPPPLCVSLECRLSVERVPH